MAKARFHVQQFVVCRRAEVHRAAPNNPYTLRDVAYVFEVPADTEFPAVEPELWAFVRFVNGRGRRGFGIEVVWLDGPGGEQVTGFYMLAPVVFGVAPVVLERAWKLNNVRFEGSGRYEFRLRAGAGRLFARDFIEVRRGL